MVEENGQEYVDEIFKDKQKSIKVDVLWYETKIAEYSLLLEPKNVTESHTIDNLLTEMELKNS